MRSVSLVVALVVAIVLAAIASPSPEVTYRIDHVTDGDTVVLRNGQTIGAGAPWFYEGRRGRYAARLEALAKGAKANELGLWRATDGKLHALVNPELDAHFDLPAFEHVARWNDADERNEMWLRASSPQRMRIDALDLTVDFAAGEEMLTEVSCKFRPDGVAAELADAGLRCTHWWTDAAGDFGLSLSTK